MLKIIDFFSSIDNEEESISGFYTIKGVIVEKKIFDLLNALETLFKSEIIQGSSQLTLPDETPFSLYTLNELKDLISSNSDDPKTFEIKLQKNDTKSEIYIFSISTLKKNIQKALVDNLLAIQLLNKFFSKKVMLLEYSISRYLEYTNNDKLELFTKEINKNIRFSSSNPLKITPYNIELEKIKVADSNPYVNQYAELAQQLKHFLCMMYIASEIDILNSEFIISFNGKRERIYKLTVDDIINNFTTSNTFKELFFWIYKREDERSQNFHERLEIVRNLIAFTFESKDDILKNSHNYDILKKSRSSYEIYLSSKTKEYFELRFKVEDHIEKLFTNLGDEFSKFMDYFRNNLYTFIGFMFTSVLVASLRSQSPVDFLSNGSASLIIFMFGLLSFVLLITSSIRYFSNISDLVNKKNDLQKKYEKFFDSEDLAVIIGKSFDQREKKDRKSTISIIFVWLAIVLVLLFNAYLSSKYRLLIKDYSSHTIEQIHEQNPFSDTNESSGKIEK